MIHGGGGALQLPCVRVCVHACVLVQAFAVAVLLLNGGVWYDIPDRVWRCRCVRTRARFCLRERACVRSCNSRGGGHTGFSLFQARGGRVERPWVFVSVSCVAWGQFDGVRLSGVLCVWVFVYVYVVRAQAIHVRAAVYGTPSTDGAMSRARAAHPSRSRVCVARITSAFCV